MPPESEKRSEVHVRVRLANASDFENAEKGILPPDKVRNCEVDAVIDTGATRSFIPAALAEQLGVVAGFYTEGTLADGTSVPVAVSTALVFEIEGRKTFEGAYILGNEVLIGQLTLQATDLLVDCTNHRVIPRHAEGPLFRL